MSTQDTWLHLLSSVAHPDTTQDKTTLLAVCPCSRMTLIGCTSEGDFFHLVLSNLRSEYYIEYDYLNVLSKLGFYQLTDDIQEGCGRDSCVSSPVSCTSITCINCRRTFYVQDSCLRSEKHGVNLNSVVGSSL